MILVAKGVNIAVLIVQYVILTQYIIIHKVGLLIENTVF